jgi:hypothetical protein
MVAFKSAVHDSSIALLGNALFPYLGIKPVGVSPHIMVDFAKFHGARSVVLHRLPEGRVEISIVEKHVRVVVPAVEVSLDRLYRLDNTVQLLVPGEDDEGTICPWSAGIRFKAPRHEYLIVLFADFPVQRG